MKSVCIGLFGTCGNSTWRNDFIQRYLQRGMKDGVDFFNPQVKDWKPELAEIEATHLSEDQILCFPVTKETYGTGSLAETGFSIMQGLKFDDRREILLLIDPIPDPSLDVDDPDKGLSRVAYKESTRARALVRQHIKKITWSNVRLLDTLEEMQEWSIYLHAVKTDLNNYKPVLIKPKIDIIEVKEELPTITFDNIPNCIAYFSAPWCGPCKVLSPVIEEVASELYNSDGIEFIKVDTDMYPDIAKKYNIRSVPTLLFFKDGKVINSTVGAYPKSKILAIIIETFNLTT